MASLPDMYTCCSGRRLRYAGPPVIRANDGRRPAKGPGADRRCAWGADVSHAPI
jgi:hypothetical protein